MVGEMDVVRDREYANLPKRVIRLPHFTPRLNCMIALQEL
jgi:hypothetical protein